MSYESFKKFKSEVSRTEKKSIVSEPNPENTFVLTG
jgi:hypothetical protein